MATPVQTRLSEVIAEAKALSLKGILTKEENEKFDALCTESDTLLATKAASDRFASLEEFATKSAGQLPLSGGDPPVGQVMVNSLTAAGYTKIGHSHEVKGNTYRRSIELLDEYGEGIVSAEQATKTGTPEYKMALRSYVCKGERGLKANELKVLQEGIDTEGGLAA